MKSKPKLNAEWHKQHRMPKNPTEEQRIVWHIEHAKHCGCREMPEKLKVYIIRPPEIPKELDRAKEMMAGGVCIIDSRSVLLILGVGEQDAVALFSESEGFVRFFVRYYSLIFNRAKKLK